MPDTVRLGAALAVVCPLLIGYQPRGAASQPNPALPAVVDETHIGQYFFVDNLSPDASDNNSGAQDQPFQTIGGAVRAADRPLLQGVGVKIVIHPGVYRESINLVPRGNQTKATLVFEAAQPRTVFLDGADIWTGWTRQAANVYSHPWPYQWGLAPYPSGWQGNVVLQPIVRQREMVFVNGTQLTQVLSSGALFDNSFFVSESAGTITLRLAPDLTPGTVEVALRAPVFQAHVRKNLVLRGLVFRHSASGLPSGAVWITDSSGVLLENCDATANNWGGFDIQVSNDVTFRHSTAENNGASGLGGYRLKRALFEDTDTSNNNWRGAQGGLFGWDIAGAKLSESHDVTMSRYTSSGNQARGLWFDTDSTNIVIDSNAWYWNSHDGLFLEANEGPISVSNSLSCENTGAGLSLATTTDVTVHDNVFCGNSGGQIQVTGDVVRAVSDWETGARYDLQDQRWTWFGNTFETGAANQLWLIAPNWTLFQATLNSSGNTWIKSGDPRGFRVGSFLWALKDWQSRVEVDLDSVFMAQ